MNTTEIDDADVLLVVDRGCGDGHMKAFLGQILKKSVVKRTITF